MRADAERNRRRLLDAACEAFLDQGPEASLEAIARAAGVGIGTLYRHFPDRSRLLRALAHDVITRTAAEADAALEAEPSAFDALRRYLHRALDVGVPVMSRIHMLIDKDDEYRAWADAGVSALHRIFSQARREGSLRPDVEFADVGTVLVRFARPIGGGFTPALERPVAHRQLDIYVDGLRAGTTTPLSPDAALSLERLRGMGGT